MRCINVQALVQRERNLIVVQRRIRRCVVRLNGRVGEASHELLNVADTLNTCDGGSESGVVPEEVHWAQRF